MASFTEPFKSFSHDELLAKARWFKEDLEKGEWREIIKRPECTFWIKTFPEEKVPIKILYKYHLPLPAQKFVEVYSPANVEYRHKWDKAFVENEVLEEYPDNGGHVYFNIVKVSWPLSDRDFVVFIPPAKEVDWYGKQAFLLGCVHASHPSKPANVAGCVRGTNGGNFYVVTRDEKDPENACTVFALTNNNYNGWLPKTNIEWLEARTVPKSFITLFEGIVEGYKMFFANE